VLLYLFAGCALYFAQDRLVLFPGRDDPQAAFAAEHDFELSRWTTAGNYRGLVAEPRSVPIKGTILVFHGNALSVNYRLFIAANLTPLGYRVALAEYPGYGGRDGVATVRALMASAEDDYRVAAHTWPGTMILLSESFGGGLVAQIARRHGREIAGLILITPWDSLAALAQEKFRIFPAAWLLHERLDSVAALAGFTRPVVVAAAENDEVIPASHAEALAARLADATFFLMRGAAHNTWPQFVASENWAAWLALVEPQQQMHADNSKPRAIADRRIAVP
jgi:hypothetical protein